jgi:tetratricopeptide (TPR) repeat protein
MPTEKFSTRNLLKSAERAEKAGDVLDAANQYALIAFRLPNHPTASRRLKKLHKMMTGSADLTQNDVNNLVSLLQSDDMSNAAALATRLICLAPKEAVLHNFQGIALSRISEIDKAERAFRTAIKLRPNYAEALGNLGTILREAEKFEEAEIVLGKALDLNSNIIEANNSMGLVLSHLGRHEEALKYLDAAIALNPNYANAFNSKGLALKGLGQVDGAISAFKAGLKLDESNTDILINLGYAYSQITRHTEAITFIQKALDLRPPNEAEFTFRLAVLQGQNGETESANQTIRSAIRLDPEHAEPYRFMTTLKKYTLGDPEIVDMEKRFENSKESAESHKHLSFALGKVYEDIGKPQKAFEFWAVGNKLERQGIVYSTQKQKALFDRVCESFGSEFFESYTGRQNDSHTSIFVVGMMRSGTTLVEQILSSHSQVFGAGEQTFLNTYADNWIAENRSPDMGFDDLIKGYTELISEISGNAPHVIDKMPINFLWIGMVKAAFPNAKIINLVRDPRDVGLSIFKNYFTGGGNGYAFDLIELAEFYLLYKRMMEHWRFTLPNTIYDISYEAVVGDLEGETRKLLKFVNLDWEDRLLSFQKTKRVVKTASVTQVREAIYSSSVSGWRNYEKELAPYINILTNAGALDG